MGKWEVGIVDYRDLSVGGSPGRAVRVEFDFLTRDRSRREGSGTARKLQARHGGLRAFARGARRNARNVHRTAAGNDPGKREASYKKHNGRNEEIGRDRINDDYIAISPDRHSTRCL